MPGRRRISCWRGMAAVRAGTQGLLAAREQPLTLANGTASGGYRIGGQTVFMARGVPMAGPGPDGPGLGPRQRRLLLSPLRFARAKRAGGANRELAQSRPAKPVTKRATPRMGRS